MKRTEDFNEFWKKYWCVDEPDDNVSRWILRILVVSVLGDNDYGIKQKEKMVMEHKMRRNIREHMANYYYNPIEGMDLDDPEVIVDNEYFQLEGIPAILKTNYAHVLCHKVMELISHGSPHMRIELWEYLGPLLTMKGIKIPDISASQILEAAIYTVQNSHLYQGWRMPKMILKTLEEILGPKNVPWKECPDQLLDLCSCSFEAVRRSYVYRRLAIWSLQYMRDAITSGQFHKKIFEGLFKRPILTNIIKFAFRDPQMNESTKQQKASILEMLKEVLFAPNALKSMADTSLELLQYYRTDFLLRETGNAPGPREKPVSAQHYTSRLHKYVFARSYGGLYSVQLKKAIPWLLESYVQATEAYNAKNEAQNTPQGKCVLEESGQKQNLPSFSCFAFAISLSLAVFGFLPPSVHLVKSSDEAQEKSDFAHSKLREQPERRDKLMIFIALQNHIAKHKLYSPTEDCTNIQSGILRCLIKHALNESLELGPEAFVIRLNLVRSLLCLDHKLIDVPLVELWRWTLHDPENPIPGHLQSGNENVSGGNETGKRLGSRTDEKGRKKAKLKPPEEEGPVCVAPDPFFERELKNKETKNKDEGYPKGIPRYTEVCKGESKLEEMFLTAALIIKVYGQARQFPEVLESFLEVWTSDQNLTLVPIGESRYFQNALTEVARSLPSGQSSLVVALLANSLEKIFLDSKSECLTERELSALNIGHMLLSQCKVKSENSVALASAFAKIVTHGLLHFSRKINDMIDGSNQTSQVESDSVQNPHMEIHTDLYKNLTAFWKLHHVSSTGLQKCAGLNPEISKLSFLNKITAAMRSAILLFCNTDGAEPDDIEPKSGVKGTTDCFLQHTDAGQFCALLEGDPLLAKTLSYALDIVQNWISLNGKEDPQIELLRRDPVISKFVNALVPCLLDNLTALREQRLHQMHANGKNMVHEGNGILEQGVSKQINWHLRLIIRLSSFLAGHNTAVLRIKSQAIVQAAKFALDCDDLPTLACFFAEALEVYIPGQNSDLTLAIKNVFTSLVPASQLQMVRKAWSFAIQSCLRRSLKNCETLKPSTELEQFLSNLSLSVPAECLEWPSFLETEQLPKTSQYPPRDPEDRMRFRHNRTEPKFKMLMIRLSSTLQLILGIAETVPNSCASPKMLLNLISLQTQLAKGAPERGSFLHWAPFCHPYLRLMLLVMQNDEILEGSDSSNSTMDFLQSSGTNLAWQLIILDEDYQHEYPYAKDEDYLFDSIRTIMIRILETILLSPCSPTDDAECAQPLELWREILSFSRPETKCPNYRPNYRKGNEELSRIFRALILNACGDVLSKHQPRSGARLMPPSSITSGKVPENNHGVNEDFWQACAEVFHNTLDNTVIHEPAMKLTGLPQSEDLFSIRLGLLSAQVSSLAILHASGASSSGECLSAAVNIVKGWCRNRLTWFTWGSQTHFIASSMPLLQKIVVEKGFDTINEDFKWFIYRLHDIYIHYLSQEDPLGGCLGQKSTEKFNKNKQQYLQAYIKYLDNLDATTLRKLLHQVVLDLCQNIASDKTSSSFRNEVDKTQGKLLVLSIILDTRGTSGKQNILGSQGELVWCLIVRQLQNIVQRSKSKKNSYSDLGVSHYIAPLLASLKIIAARSHMYPLGAGQIASALSIPYSTLVKADNSREANTLRAVCDLLLALLRYRTTECARLQAHFQTCIRQMLELQVADFNRTEYTRKTCLCAKALANLYTGIGSNQEWSKTSSSKLLLFDFLETTQSLQQLHATVIERKAIENEKLLAAWKDLRHSALGLFQNCNQHEMHRVSSACRDRPFSGLMIAELKSMKKDFDEQVKYSGKT